MRTWKALESKDSLDQTRLPALAAVVVQEQNNVRDQVLVVKPKP